MTMPLPNDTKKDGQLDVDEVAQIMDRTLKPKHRNDPIVIGFIESFVRCKNASQAARENGLHSHKGPYLRNKTDIANCIQRLIDRSVVKYGFDATETVERVKEIVDIDPIEFENPDGTFKTSLAEIRPEARRAIKKFKAKNLFSVVEDRNGIKQQIITGQLIEVELYDKMKGVELLGREKDLFKQTTKVEHAPTKEMANILLESKKLALEASKNIEQSEQTPEVIDVTPAFPMPNNNGSSESK